MELTFLLTDIEGSTVLWEQDEEAMQVALALHDSIVQRCVSGRGGRLVKSKGEGDSTFSVFSNPSDAVSAAKDIILSLQKAEWASTQRVRVRIAVHTGSAQERDNDYYGPTINRCARLRAVANGDQILVSAATARAAESLSTIRFDDLGVHRLKDLRDPEHIFQVVADGIPHAFPSLQTLDLRRHNLPTETGAFIGREEELRSIRDVLSSSRLVTVIGPAGVGKTRLAIESGRALVESYPDGVWLVDLTTADDHDSILHGIAGSIGLSGGRLTRDAMLQSLAPKDALLVLDNAEHVIPLLADLVNALLRGCPALHVLVTSRAALTVPGEALIRTEPLETPRELARPSVENVARAPAARLFIERAIRARGGKTLEDRDASAIAEICTRLDGLPLAIELAAARAGTVEIAEIARRLRERFRSLSLGGHTSVAHHSTMRATIEWSYRLLDAEEQAFLRCLGVFEGGFTGAAAVALVDGADVEESLERLVDRSLVTYKADTQRYSLLQTIREFALEQLQAAPDATEVGDRHAAWCTRLIDEASEAHGTTDERLAYETLDEELGNVHAALSWTLSRRPDAGLSMAANLWRYWENRGMFDEGRTFLERALSRSGAQPTSDRARALTGLGLSAFWRSDYDSASANLQEALAIAREVGDLTTEGTALVGFGLIAEAEGRYDDSLEHYKQALAVRTQDDDRWGQASVLNNMGVLYWVRGQFEQARDLYARSLVLYEQIGHVLGAMWVRGNLGEVEEALGDLDGAERAYQVSLITMFEMGERLGLPTPLEGIARVAAGRGDDQRAATLLGAADALRSNMSLGDRASDRDALEPVVCALRETLRPEVFSEAWTTGASMTPSAAVEFALGREMDSND